MLFTKKEYISLALFLTISDFFSLIEIMVQSKAEIFFGKIMYVTRVEVVLFTTVAQARANAHLAMV